MTVDHTYSVYSRYLRFLPLSIVSQRNKEEHKNIQLDECKNLSSLILYRSSSGRLWAGGEIGLCSSSFLIFGGQLTPSLD